MPLPTNRGSYKNGLLSFSMSAAYSQRVCGRSVAKLISHRKALCHFKSHIFIGISFFFLSCILYFYLLGQMWQIKYKIHIKEYNKRKTIFACPNCPSQARSIKFPCVYAVFQRLMASSAWQTLWQEPTAFCSIAVQPYCFIPGSALPEGHRHQQGNPH